MTLNRMKYDRAVTALHYTIEGMSEGLDKDALWFALKGITDAVNDSFTDEDLEREESERARRAAEHRLAYHGELDTLDTY